MRPDWIQDDVAGQFQQILFLLHQDGFVAALQYVPDKLVAPIEMLGINAIQLAHALRQIRFHRFNEQMIMIAHLAETVHDKMVPLTYQHKHFLPGKAIGIVPVNGAAPVAARSNVIESAGKFKA